MRQSGKPFKKERSAWLNVAIIIAQAVIVVILITVVMGWVFIGGAK